MRIARLAVRRDFDLISEMLADTDFYGAANDLEALLAYDREPTFPYWVVEDEGEIVGVAETNFRPDVGDVAYSGLQCAARIDFHDLRPVHAGNSRWVSRANSMKARTRLVPAAVSAATG